MKKDELIEEKSIKESTALIQEQLFVLQDKKYQEFKSKLIPNIPKETIIGIRTPLLRKLAKDLAGTVQAENFLKDLPHKYDEENNLHAFLIERIRDYEEALRKTEKFLPYINNWGTCDSFFIQNILHGWQMSIVKSII